MSENSNLIDSNDLEKRKPNGFMGMRGKKGKTSQNCNENLIFTNFRIHIQYIFLLTKI